MSAEAEEKVHNAAKSAKVLVDAIKTNLRPLDLLTKKSFENAISVIMAIGGSTNAVLHLLAIARTAGVNLKIDDFERYEPYFWLVIPAAVNIQDLLKATTANAA